MGKAGDSVGTVAQKAKTPALMGTVAAAGLAGGMAVGSRFLSRPKLTGRSGPVKTVTKEMREVGKEIGKAGFRVGVGDVSMELKKGSKEKRDSPLEVLLKGLTNRHTERR